MSKPLLWKVYKHLKESAFSEGSVTDRFGRQTGNPEFAGSRPALSLPDGLFHTGLPEFNSSVTLVNSQLFRILVGGIFYLIILVEYP